MSNLKILLVDKHSIMRIGVIQVLKGEFNNVEFGESSSAFDAITKLGKQRWDIVIMELDLPDKHGMELSDYIKHNFAEVNILVFTSYRVEQFGVRIVKEGDSFLTKDCEPEELIKAVETLNRGEIYISNKLANLLVNEVSGKNEDGLHSSLSNREFQVFLRLAIGKSLTAIADELSLSVKTISTYRSHILTKMNFKNNADIIRYATDNGFSQN